MSAFPRWVIKAITSRIAPKATGCDEDIEQATLPDGHPFPLPPFLRVFWARRSRSPPRLHLHQGMEALMDMNTITRGDFLNRPRQRNSFQHYAQLLACTQAPLLRDPHLPLSFSIK